MPHDLVVSVPGSALLDALVDRPAGVEFVEWDFSGPPPRADLDIVVPPYMGASGRLHRLSEVRARLVQSQSIGYDDVADVLPPGNVFANAASVHETSTAELALALILALQRGLPDFVRAAEQGRWAPARHASLADREVLIVGHGGVGAAIAARLAPFETTVVRVARTACAGVHSIDELPTLLPSADIVVIAVPLTDGTRGMVDAAFLGAMRDGAMLVNIARGAVAVTEAVLAEAARGRLRFALDVTDPEPLPEGHPLFALPNVLISPHVGGASSAMMPRMARLLAQQIERMIAGQEPLNVVLRT